MNSRRDLESRDPELPSACLLLGVQHQAVLVYITVISQSPRKRITAIVTPGRKPFPLSYSPNDEEHPAAREVVMYIQVNEKRREGKGNKSEEDEHASACPLSPSF